MWLGQLEEHWAVVWQDVQQVKVYAAKPEDLSSVPWIHIVDPADCPLASTYAPWSVCIHAWVDTHTCLHKIMDRLPSLFMVREMTGHWSLHSGQTCVDMEMHVKPANDCHAVSEVSV